MGLFSFLFGDKTAPNVNVNDDEIYLTTNGKFINVANVLREKSQADSISIVLVAHWDVTLERLQQVVAESGVECIAVKSAELSPDMARRLHFDENETIDLIVGERHLIKAGDDRVIEFAEALACKSRVVHMLSLEDEIMRVFCGDMVRDMMRSLGMKEDECIQSSLVARRIKRAQKQIERNIQEKIGGLSPLLWIDQQYAQGKNDFNPME